MIDCLCDKDTTRLIERVLNSNDVDSTVDLLLPIIDEYSCYYSNLGTGQGTLFRARKCDERKNNGFDNISDLWHPRADNILTSGRFNDIGQPMLYLACTLPTALAEVGAHKGDYIQIAQYVTGANQYIKCGFVGELSHVYTTRKVRNAPEGPDPSKNSLDLIISKLDHMDQDAKMRYLFVDSLFDSISRTKQDLMIDYTGSRAVARIMFRCHKSFDAFAYPSVVCNDSMNLVVKPDAAAEKMSVVNTCVVRIDYACEQFGLYRFTSVRDSGVFDSNGNIIYNVREFDNMQHVVDLQPQ